MATALDVVMKELSEKRESLSRALVEGGAKDFAEYRFMAGEIRGLSLAHAYIQDLVRRLENDDE